MCSLHLTGAQSTPSAAVAASSGNIFVFLVIIIINGSQRWGCCCLCCFGNSSHCHLPQSQPRLLVLSPQRSEGASDAGLSIGQQRAGRRRRRFCHLPLATLACCCYKCTVCFIWLWHAFLLPPKTDLLTALPRFNPAISLESISSSGFSPGCWLHVATSCGRQSVRELPCGPWWVQPFNQVARTVNNLKCSKFDRCISQLPHATS